MRIKKFYASAAIAVVAAALGGVAIGNAADSSSISSSPQAESLVSTTARSDMAQFRRTRSTADAVPAALLGGPLTEGAVPDSSRRVQVSADRAGWVMAGQTPNSLCYVAPGASTCDDSADLDKNGLIWLFSFRPGEPARIEGIAADNITTVTAHYTDGTDQSVDVVQNGFDVELPAGKRPTGLTWSGPRGTGDIAVNLPDKIDIGK